MATKLRVYNTALRYCSERKIASLTESRESRRLLDDVWDNGGVDNCLEDAMWKFATKTVRIDYDTTVARDFGYTYALSKPDDWMLTAAVCSDEYYEIPLTRYDHENNYWYADLTELYVKYISNASDYGNDLSLWPASFSDYVSAWFANEIVDKLTSNDVTIQRVVDRLAKNKLKAKGRDAWNQPSKFPAPGNWVTSRGRLRGDNRDRGNRGSLLG